MRMIIGILFCTMFLTGCASTSKEQLYYDAAKAISKDHTMSQAACWSAITEIAKGGSEAAKVGAISLADRCKNEGVKLEAPKKGLLGF